jgi:hypothetical protein
MNFCHRQLSSRRLIEVGNSVLEKKNFIRVHRVDPPVLLLFSGYLGMPSPGECITVIFIDHEK